MEKKGRNRSQHRKSVKTQENEKKVGQKGKKKLVIKDMYKFVTFAAVSLILIVGIIVIIIVNAKVKIDENTKISTLNANKYHEEIKAEYEKEGKDEVFLTDWNKVQDVVGRYFIENYPSEKEQAQNLVNEINNILQSQNWEKINSNPPTMWNGTWEVDENGNVSFKFANKEIEPSWVETFSGSNAIRLNE